jgi:hypothetical protein
LVVLLMPFGAIVSALMLPLVEAWLMPPLIPLALMLSWLMVPVVAGFIVFALIVLGAMLLGAIVLLLMPAAVWAKAGPAAARLSAKAASSFKFVIGKLLLGNPASSGARNIGKTAAARQCRLSIGSIPGRRQPAGAIW